MIFASYLKGFNSEVCPVGREIVYSDGHVDCSVHGKKSMNRIRGEKLGFLIFRNPIINLGWNGNGVLAISVRFNAYLTG
jgi:hypothetical protein